MEGGLPGGKGDPSVETNANGTRIPESLPGRQFVLSNASAGAYTAQQAEAPRNQAVADFFSWPVPMKSKSGYMSGNASIADSMLTSKTASADSGMDGSTQDYLNSLGF